MVAEAVGSLSGTCKEEDRRMGRASKRDGALFERVEN
jgi:hypothetical protein